MREIKTPLEESIDDYRVTEEPFYIPIRNEVKLFQAAYESKIPAILKGPTGCGKTRFVQYMAYRLKRPLMTIACHEDLTTSDLVGRYLFTDEETRWYDGPLTKAVKQGAICYLDEIVEARKDTTVVIHPLTDDRRILPIEKRGEIIKAPDTFMMVLSFNPGYQSVLKDLKQSTKQRFIAIEFHYPPEELECQVVEHESQIDHEIALVLVKIANKVRNLKEHGLEEGVSTRLLIYAGKLVSKGIDIHEACEVAITKSLTDDIDMQRAIREVISDYV